MDGKKYFLRKGHKIDLNYAFKLFRESENKNFE